MLALISGFILFFGLHFLPEIASIRAGLLARHGEKGYMAVYAVLSLLGLVLFIRGLSAIPVLQLWQPFDGSRTISIVLMWFSVYCLVSMFLPSTVRRVTRHPMLLGVALWSVAHLLVNGDLHSLVLFGSFGVFAIYKIPALNKRKPGVKSDPIPLAQEVLAVAVAAVVYIAGLYVHPWIAGVPLLA